MGKPFLPGIQRLAQQILLEKAEKTKAAAIEITKNDLQEHTSLYLDSFHLSVDGPLAVSVANTAQYAYILEQGQKPHIIRAKNGHSLRFIWNNPPSGAPAPNSPPYHQFALVHHPGAIAYQILNRAMHLAMRAE